MTNIVNKIKVMQFENKNYGNCFVEKGSRFEVGHHLITWNDGKNEKYGVLLFLPLIVGVWRLEGKYCFVEYSVTSFELKILKVGWMVGIGVRRVPRWFEGCFQASEEGWKHIGIS